MEARCMGKNSVKAICYPGLPKNTSLDRLVELAQIDGRRILGAYVTVLDRMWSDICGFWVVVVGLDSVSDSSVHEDKMKHI